MTLVTWRVYGKRCWDEHNIKSHHNVATFSRHSTSFSNASTDSSTSTLQLQSFIISYYSNLSSNYWGLMSVPAILGIQTWHYIYIYIDLFPCLRLPFSSALRKNFKFMPFKFEETEWKKQPILKEGKVITRAIPQCDLFDSFRWSGRKRQGRGRRRKTKKTKAMTIDGNEWWTSTQTGKNNRSSEYGAKKNMNTCKSSLAKTGSAGKPPIMRPITALITNTSAEPMY